MVHVVKTVFICVPSLASPVAGEDLYIKMTEWIKGYLVFSRKERTGVMALRVLILLVWLLPGFFGKPERLSEELLIHADSAHRVMKQVAREEGGVVKTFRLFPFDPNLASEADWELMGVRPKTIATIRNYLNKGGKFRRPEDLMKIYGLRKDEGERLMPFVRIERQAGVESKQGVYSGYAARLPSRARSGTDQNSYPSAAVWKSGTYGERYERGSRRAVDINTADSSLWESLPGIGPRLASRIIRFRAACGGFYSIEQVSEIYGISDTLFDDLRPLLTLGNAGVRKININSWNADSLALHPYVRKHEAHAIVNYRKQHGPFHSVADLARISILSDAWIEKIGFYLSFE